jgi:hypothetical protein
MVHMNEDMKRLEQIERAQKLLKTVKHASYATVNEDGTPHNSPLMFIYNEDFTKLYVGTFTESLHTKNLVRTGKTFVVLYDSFTSGQGGVYITGVNAHECEGDELIEALRVHNMTRARYEKSSLELEYYQRPKPAQRMYSTDIAKIEVYSSLKNKDGLIVREERIPVDRTHLIPGN